MSWDDAFAEIDRRLGPLLEEHGRDAVAVYLGNPNAHNLDALLYGRAFVKALGTRNVYSATTVDQMPKHVSAGLMFGTALSIPIPDVDRTGYLLMLGANPLASNGSLLTAPDMRGRLRGIRDRGGRWSWSTRAAAARPSIADEHHFIRPGTDAHLLFAMAQRDRRGGPRRPRRRRRSRRRARGGQELAARVHAPRRRRQACGIDAATIRRMARELATAESAAVYGRIGTCTQEFGTLASWLVDVLNVVTGNLDRPGGAMFTRPLPAPPTRAAPRARARACALGRWQHPRPRPAEVFGELPVAVPGRGDRHPGRRPGPGAVHARRQPGR